MTALFGGTISAQHDLSILLPRFKTAVRLCWRQHSLCLSSALTKERLEFRRESIEDSPPSASLPLPRFGAAPMIVGRAVVRPLLAVGCAAGIGCGLLRTGTPLFIENDAARIVAPISAAAAAGISVGGPCDLADPGAGADRCVPADP